MDKLVKILNELLAIQSRLDAIISFKTHANAATLTFFKGDNIKNLIMVQEQLEKAIDRIRQDFQNYDFSQLKK